MWRSMLPCLSARKEYSRNIIKRPCIRSIGKPWSIIASKVSWTSSLCRRRLTWQRRWWASSRLSSSRRPSMNNMVSVQLHIYYTAFLCVLRSEIAQISIWGGLLVEGHLSCTSSIYCCVKLGVQENCTKYCILCRMVFDVIVVTFLMALLMSKSTSIVMDDWNFGWNPCQLWNKFGIFCIWIFL